MSTTTKKHYAIWHRADGLLAGGAREGVYTTIIGTEQEAVTAALQLRDDGIDVRRVIEGETGRRVFLAVPV